MKIAIVGGKLQGVEATYLAHKAGWEVILFDKALNVPASNLADSFHRLDVIDKDSSFARLIKGTSLIIPALEDTSALMSLKKIAAEENIPFAFDADTYSVSRSKKKSNLLFAKLGIPTPNPWPKCDLPIIMKPSGSSGSSGIRKISSREDFSLAFTQYNHELEDCVIQEFLEGPSYSLEVIGIKGNFIPLQTTKIEVDCFYDCKRVIAPSGLAQSVNEKFIKTSLKIAEALNLKGIMDVEGILHQDAIKILEIDARLPSQTPSAVYNSLGINMLELIHDVFNRDCMPRVPHIQHKKEVIFEHIKVSPHALEVSGEHIMADVDSLKLYEDFFGADEALTDFSPGRSHWVATLIIKGEEFGEAWEKRCEVIKNIQNSLGLSRSVDLEPEQQMFF